ncbi:MAG TPA: acetolactate synthase small subunit [Myxococcales bacterium]|jgi:acetolactate synthase I/III small subunit|nr:acetolactate synthase small subunit [Myxococcales bacterium]
MAGDRALARAPAPAPRTFIVHVEDRPGALNRIVSLFRRRTYNIDSLTVGRTERPQISRITLVVHIDEGAAARLAANLYKLLDVLEVQDVTSTPVVVRELAFIKLPAKARGEVMQLCEVFRARIVDLGPESLTVETTGAQDKIDGLIEALAPLGILELVRTGAVAITRGAPASDGAVQAGKAGSEDPEMPIDGEQPNQAFNAEAQRP